MNHNSLGCEQPVYHTGLDVEMTNAQGTEGERDRGREERGRYIENLCVHCICVNMYIYINVHVHVHARMHIHVPSPDPSAWPRL